MLKCVGCRFLIREAQNPDKVNPKFPLVVYGCQEERLPYWTSLSGLMRPGRGNKRAADDCSRWVTCGCVVCGDHKDLLTYGIDKFVSICPVHDKAWGKWLDGNDQDGFARREYISPRKRVIRKKWVELFWEFIQEVRLAK